MSVNKVNSAASFNGIRISKNVPKDIVKTIKKNPAIKRAGKSYSLAFYYGKGYNGTQNPYVSCVMTSPSIDGFWGKLTTPAHSIKKDSYMFGLTNDGIKSEIEEVSRGFFEDRIGTPRTATQKLKAFIEGIQLRFAPKNRTIVQEVKRDKILSKYENMNIPE